MPKKKTVKQQRAQAAKRRSNAYTSGVSDAPHSQSTVSSRRNTAIMKFKKSMKKP